MADANEAAARAFSAVPFDSVEDRAAAAKEAGARYLRAQEQAERDVTDSPSEDGWTFGDLEEMFGNLGSSLQTAILERAIRRDPTIAGGLLFPGYTDPERLVGSMEVQRELQKRAVKEAVRLVQSSNAPPVWPTRLDITSEALAEGRLRAPEPTVGGLLYPGRVNALYGTHTAGKTWTALYLASRNEGQTLFLDYEDTEAGVAARCMALSPGLASSVSYFAPQGAVSAAALEAFIAQHDITLVIIDSTGESLAAAGYDSNSEQDVTAWFTEVPDAIAALGPAVLLLDHIAKKQDGTPSPIGSFRKSAAITGAQFALENRVGFSRLRPGWSRLTCTKDRNGFFATGEVVGRIDFTPDDGAMAVTFRRGEEETTRLHDSREQAILDYVHERMAEVHGRLDDDGNEMDGRPNITQIRGEVKGDSTRVKETVDRLVLNGWLRREHIKSGKTTRDVYVPGSGGLTPIDDE